MKKDEWGRRRLLDFASSRDKALAREMARLLKEDKKKDSGLAADSAVLLQRLETSAQNAEWELRSLASSCLATAESLIAYPAMPLHDKSQPQHQREKIPWMRMSGRCLSLPS